MRVAAVVLGLVLPSIAAAVPVQFAHSGYLLDATDNPVNAASLAVTFRLFDAAEATTPVYSATCSVVVHEGYFAATIGDGTCGSGLDSAQLPADATRWLELVVDATPLVPRIALNALPASSVARLALDAQKLGGVAATSLVDGASGLLKYAALPVGTTAGTIAAGDDARISGALQGSASAAGDLGNTWGAPSVVALRGSPIAATAPSASGQVLGWNGSAWGPVAPAPDATKLPLSGGTMTGAIDLGGFGVKNLLAPVAAGDAVTKGYADGFLGGRALSGALPATNQILSWTGSTWAPTTPSIGVTLVTLTDAATIAVDATAGNVWDVTLGGNRAIANPTGLVNGATYQLRVRQDATGNRTLTFGSNWLGVRAPTPSAGALTIYTLASDGTKVYVTGQYPSANAAVSCKAILAAGGSTGNGTYVISTPTGNASVFCDMANGGWTRVLSNPLTTDFAGLTFTRSGTACGNRVQTITTSGWWMGHGNGDNTINVAGMGAVEWTLNLSGAAEVTDATQIRHTGSVQNMSDYDYATAPALRSTTPFALNGEFASQVYDGTAWNWHVFYGCAVGSTCPFDLTYTPPAGTVKAPYIRWGYQWGGPLACDESNSDAMYVRDFTVWVK